MPGVERSNHSARPLFCGTLATGIADPEFLVFGSGLPKAPCINRYPLQADDAGGSCGLGQIRVDGVEIDQSTNV